MQRAVLPLQITTMRMCPLFVKAVSLLHNDMLAVRIRMTAPFTFTIPDLTKWPFEDLCVLWCSSKRDIITIWEKRGKRYKNVLGATLTLPVFPVSHISRQTNSPRASILAEEMLANGVGEGAFHRPFPLPISSTFPHKDRTSQTSSIRIVVHRIVIRVFRCRRSCRSHRC
jgi:hypothetical protein